MDIFEVLESMVTFHEKRHVVLTHELVILAVIDSVLVFVASRIIKNGNNRMPAIGLDNPLMRLHLKIGVTLTSIIKIGVSVLLFHFDWENFEPFEWQYRNVIASIVYIYAFYLVLFAICFSRDKKKPNQEAL